MRYLKLARLTMLAGIVALGFSACDKEKEIVPVDDKGQTVVKLINGGTMGAPGIDDNAIDFIPTPQKLDVADVRRDVPNAAELNKTMTVVIKDDTAAFRKYNDTLVAHGGTALVYLPASWYTLNIPRTGTIAPGNVGGTYSVVLNPGEFAKQITATIQNATLLDPSSTYGLAFSIVSADANGVILNESKAVILTIGAKNQYDGRYAVTGTLVDVTSPLFGPWLPSWEAHLVTTGANSNDVYDMEYTGGVFHPFFNAGAATYYGTFGMQVTFNPATNVVSNMVSPYVPAANTRSARLDPSFTSTFNPATHNIRIRYFMDQPNTVAGGPRVTFDETWTYLGPR